MQAPFVANSQNRNFLGKRFADLEIRDHATLNKLNLFISFI